MKKKTSITYMIMLLAFVYMATLTSHTTPQELNNIENTVLLDTTYIAQDIEEIDYSQLYSCKPQPLNDTCIEVSIVDAGIVMRIARQEGGPTLDGQLWAIRVIYNRLLSGDFGNSIWEVVSADGQFDVFTDGSYINADINENSHVALAMVEGGWDETEGALYWRAEEGSKGSWHDRKLEFIKTVEGNNYYR